MVNINVIPGPELPDSVALLAAVGLKVGIPTGEIVGRRSAVEITSDFTDNDTNVTFSKARDYEAKIAEKFWFATDCCNNDLIEL